MNDVYKVRVGGVEPRLGGDVEPVEGVGHVAGEHRPIRYEHCCHVTICPPIRAHLANIGPAGSSPEIRASRTCDVAASVAPVKPQMCAPRLVLPKVPSEGS